MPPHGDHAHDHHGHHHHIDPNAGDAKVALAVLVNLGLTLAQIVGGIVSGSLSLIADAMHNFSDAISLTIAFIARKIARRPSNADMTFGYVRAEVVAALVNYTTLIVIGLYLVYEAILRFIDPTPIGGWILVIVAGIALAVDLVTALLTFAMSKSSMNIRAAFVHNLADALGSVGVIVAGTLVILFDWWIVDPIVTIAIAGYILYLAFSEIGGAIRLLMLGSPPTLDIEALIDDLESVAGVADVHHVHTFMIDEHQYALEAHVVVDRDTLLSADTVKRALKRLARERYGIGHATLELECRGAACVGSATQTVGHATAALEHAD